MRNNLTQNTSWPFDLDISALDTASITNIVTDIENHLPLMKSDGDRQELLRVKQMFENELMEARRLH